MNVVINGENTTLSPDSTVAAVLRNYDLPSAYVVELNGTILAPDTYETCLLGEGDILEIIRFVGGG